MISAIDLNADAGESFGNWTLADDGALLRIVTSVNLACGFHAGDPATMLSSLQMARELGVSVGAHPGFPDLVGFGRRLMAVTPEQAFADVCYQVGALMGIARAVDVEVRYVKPHGALYLAMNRDEDLCRSVARASSTLELPLLVLAGSSMARWAAGEGAQTIAEAFPERGYLRDGSLAPRSHPAAVITDPNEAAGRAVALAKGLPIPAVDGGQVTVTARTLCIHGDNPAAVDIAAAIRYGLQQENIRVESF